MPAQRDIEDYLAQLDQLHRRLLDLLERKWLLDHERRPHVPPGFDPAASALDGVRADLRDVHGHFLNLATHVRDLLEGSDAPGRPAAQQHCRERLRELQQQVMQLPLAE